jgi:hypothetical protein
MIPKGDPFASTGRRAGGRFGSNDADPVQLVAPYDEQVARHRKMPAAFCCNDENL